MEKTITGYKFISEDMKSKNGNHQWEIGKWYKEENIEPYKRGFHACEQPLDSLGYTIGNKFFLVEAKGEILHPQEDVFVASEMRLIREIPSEVLKRFAIFCTKKSLIPYEEEYNDSKPRELMESTEDYLNNNISLKELLNQISIIKTGQTFSSKSPMELAAWSTWFSVEATINAVISTPSIPKAAAATTMWSMWSARLSEQNKELKRLIEEPW